MGLSDGDFSRRYQRILYKIHSFFILLAVHVYFPSHLVYGLFQQRNPRGILENLSTILNFVICTMKAFFLRSSLSAFQEINEISKVFERKATKRNEDYAFILEFKYKTELFMKIYYVPFTIVSICAAMSIIYSDTRRLLYSGYFPYDYSENGIVYTISVTYQCLALAIESYGIVHYDTCNGLLIFLLSQHVRIFNKRLSRIGYDSQLSAEENHDLLKEAVKDHIRILRFHRIVKGIISKPTFILLISSSFTVISFLVLFMFFAENNFERAYFMQVAVCSVLETSLSCYYGSELEAYISEITGSLYSCNWCEQSKSFKKDLCIFLECSQRKYEFTTGALIPVNKVTSVRMLKGCFSLFAVLNTMRQKF